MLVIVPTKYDPEKSGVLDIGFKELYLMDGAMLLNMNVFNAQNDGIPGCCCC